MTRWWCKVIENIGSTCSSLLVSCSRLCENVLGQIVHEVDCLATCFWCVHTIDHSRLSLQSTVLYANTCEKSAPLIQKASTQLYVLRYTRSGIGFGGERVGKSGQRQQTGRKSNSWILVTFETILTFRAVLRAAPWVWMCELRWGNNWIIARSAHTEAKRRINLT